MLAGEEESDSPPADALAGLAPAPEWRLKAALMELRAILSGPSIQVRCLECPPVAIARARDEGAGVTETLWGWLSR
jgi:protease-4